MCIRDRYQRRVRAFFCFRKFASAMPSKFLKPGKVVIVLQGRYAGRKAVIVKAVEEGTPDRRYGHAVVVGVDQYPLKVTKAMGKRKIAKRSQIKPFVKVVNFTHLLPTRYGLDLELKSVLGTRNVINKKVSRAKARKLLEERYKTGRNRWFFTKLRF
eukprot:TRINITY_DN1767_c0_g1_i1.p1 TRINITY_DN1767_c0_g1~~TRINITY_DN1767_c0_g1_i1.p1  ORF type:complete len:157 (-),score=47.05 TRINITY_DN1767_c0_g1_i1:73-543(-)